MEKQRTATLEALSDDNLLASIREHARWQAPSTLREDGGLLLLAGSTAYPSGYRNSIARLDPQVPAREVFASAQQFFGAQGRGFSVWVRSQFDADLEALVQSESLTMRTDVPCMSVEAPLPELPVPRGVQIERMAEARHVQDICTISAAAYTALGLPEAEAHATFAVPEALLSGPVRAFIAYRDARPVATALTILSGESAGLYWVGTVPDGGRGGLGTLCTTLATNAGFAAGARVVTLQASPFGEPIYARLGYRTYARLRWYLQRAAKSA